MQGNTVTIDVDAIPMEGMELVWCRCVDCRHALPPSYGYPARGCTKQPVDGTRDDAAWHWCLDYAPTLAHGPQGQGDPTRTPSGVAGHPVGERGASGRPAG